MALRVDTLHHPVEQLVAGRFVEGAGYAVWRSRGTRDWLLIYTHGGRGRFGHGEGEILTEPGDIVLLRPGTLHDYGVEPALLRWDLGWAHFHAKPEWTPWLEWPEEARGLMRLKLTDESLRSRVVGLLENVWQYSVSAHRRRTAMAMNTMEALLLWCDSANSRDGGGGMDARITLAMDYICRRLDRPMSLEDVADAGGLSVSRLAHLFSEQAGISPQRFIERQRLRRAEQLLRFTQRSIKEISRDVGYDNPFYFTLRFKKQTGQSPREYRRQPANS